MVEISISEDEQFLLFKAGGPRFTEIIESFKYGGLFYNPKLKLWTGKIGLYKKYYENFEEYGISVDEYTKQRIDEFPGKITQLVKITKRSDYRKFIPELMKVPPISPKA